MNCRNTPHLYLLLFLWTVLPGGMRAQANRMEVISQSQGLSDNRIRCFYKDRSGFIWIGTANGLNRYDGHYFRIFSPGNSHDSISNEFINSITEDADGNLFISTRGGLNILSPDRSRLIVYQPGTNAARQNNEVIPSSWIWDADVDASGKIWLAADGRDLTQFDPATGKFAYYPWLAFAKKQMPQRTNPYFSIRKIIPKSKEEWWLGSNAGLFSFNSRTGEFVFYGGDNGGDVWVLEYDSLSRRVYFAQESGNLYCYSETENKMRLWAAQELKSLAGDPYVDASLLHGLYLPMHQYLVRVAGDGSAPEVIGMNDLIDGGEKFESAGLVFTDDQQIKWIGTDNGIVKFDPSVNLFRFVKVQPDHSNLSINSVLYDDVSGRYFSASPFTNSLILINAKTNEREEVKFIDGIPLTDCAAVNQADETWIWILTRGHVFRYNRNTGQFSRFDVPAAARNFLFVEMIKDAEGSLWFATSDGGLFVFRSTENRWWIPSESSGFFEQAIHALYHDEVHDAVWIGTYDFGLFRYDLQRDTFSYFDSHPGAAHQLQSSLIFDINGDQRGNIWVATNSGGLSRYSYSRPPENPFDNFGLTTGLPENSILAVQCDHKNRMWLLTYHGITCINDAADVISEYPLDIGFSYSDFGVLASMASDGSILIPVKNGFIHFHPDQLSPKPYPFPIVIKNILADGNEIDWDEGEEVRFPYYRNNIEASFAALNFSRTTEIRFEYKLEGADTGWSSAPQAASLKFPNLGSGKYVLHLRARDGTGMLSSNVASFPFRIEPPFWKSLWFVFSIIVLSSLLFYALYRYRLRNIMELVEVRNKIAKDLHDDVGSSLSSIRIYSEMIRSQMPPSSQFAGQMLEKISTNARESVESMSDIVWMINPGNDAFDNLFSRMEQYASEMCSGKQMELTMLRDENVDKLRLPMDRRRNMYLIFKEAVNNAVKYSEASRLTVSLSQSDHHLNMEIADNGKGFRIDAIKKGNGLDNMKQRAKAAGGEVNIQSAGEQGTRVVFSGRIP